MRRWTTSLAVLLLTASVVRGQDTDKTEYTIGEPSDEEQQLLEFINRARLDPAGEADLLFNDYGSNWVTTNVNQFAAQDPLSWTRAENRTSWRGYTPRPALAPNGQLASMSHAWSLAMRSRDTVAQSFPDQQGLLARTAAAGFSPRWVGQLLQGYAPDMAAAHASWTIDWGQARDATTGRPGLPNRSAIINPQNLPILQFHEIGVGVVRRAAPPPGSLGPRIVTLTLAASSNTVRRFVTGVVFDDRDNDGFFDPGEGFGGVRIDVEPSAYYCVSSPTGGYAVPVAGTAGTVTVTASGVPGRASEIFRRQVSTGNTLAFGTPGNVKADFVYQRRVAAPPFAAAIAGETGTAPALGAKTLDCNVPALDPTRPTLGDIQVDVDVGHADRSRLRLALTAPDGTSVVLWEGGPGGVDLVGSFDRSLFPREPLDALVDVAYAGKWSLRVEDAADAAATVRSWSLRIRPRWEGPLHAARPALFVKSLKIKDGKKPLRDRLRLRAEIDVGEIVDDTAASRLSVVIEEAEAPHVELLRIPLTGEVGASGVVLTGGDVSHVFQPSPKGTSRSKLAVDVSGVDLPAFPRDLRVVIAMGDAVVGETIRTQRGSFRGARTAPPGGTLRIDRLKSRVHSLGRRTDVRGRLLLRGAAPVPGVLELRVGEATALWLNGPIDERQGALVYAPNGLVSRFTINPSTGRFVARVVGAAAVVDDDGRIPVSIWAAADFEAVEVRASLDVDGTYRY